MKRFTQQQRFILLTLFVLTLFSCDQSEDSNLVLDGQSAPDIVATAQATEALNSLVAALKKADEKEGTDLIGTLSSDGPFTVFAPTNDAFTELFQNLDGYDSLDDFDTDAEKELLATVLKYHVVAGVGALSTSLEDGQSIATVQGEEVTILLNDGVFLEDATDALAKVALPDVIANNGVVHVIDKVLLPQEVLDALAASDEEETKTLVDVVVATESLSVLKDAVVKAGLAETLSSDGPFTVLAPTNDAFIALLELLGDNYHSLDDFDTQPEIDLLRDILLYHVIPAKVLEADLSPGEVGTAFEGNSVEIIASGNSFVIGDASNTLANITATDILASNGVAHTIDKVLLPQSAIDFVASLNLKTIVEIAVATDDLSLLVAALVQADAGLVEALGAEGTFTVFAPTNQAFKDLLAALGDDFHSLEDFDTPEEKELLVEVLTYHVVAGTEAFSTDLTNGQTIETLQGEKVTIRLNNGVHIDDATEENASVILPDVVASNGVVYVIDKVLLPQAVLDALHPPLPNIVELAQSVDNLSLLVEALIQADAGLPGALSGGEYTVFAPTNAAFEALLHRLGNRYNSISDFKTDEEKALLAKILTYHVVGHETLASGDIRNHQAINTLQGEKVIAFVGSSIRLKDKTSTRAKVTGADNFASNGVVHLIDKVMLPREVLNLLH